MVETSVLEQMFFSLLTIYSNYVVLDEALAFLYQLVKEQQNLEKGQHSGSSF